MLRLLLVLIAITFASPALAGMRAVYESEPWVDGLIQVEIADNGDFRVGNEDLYILSAGGTTFAITKTASFRLSDAIAALERLGSPKASQDPRGKPVSIERLGSRQVNGRTGIAYQVQGLTFGPSEPIEFVMSDDPALAPIGRTLEQFVASKLLRLRRFADQQSVQDQTDGLLRLFNLGVPIDGLYRLLHVETARIPPERLKPPAKLQTVDDIVEALTYHLPAPP